jgi:hypothetical protein
MCRVVEFKTPAESNRFQLRYAFLEGAGFEFWDVIMNSQDLPEGVIFHCNTHGSAFNGEIVDLYTNGEAVQTHTIKGKKPLFKFGNY